LGFVIPVYVFNVLYFLCYVFFSFCCAGWGYIVAVTKVLTVYWLCHTGIHSFHCSPLLSPPWFMEQFQQVFFHLHACVYTFCTIITLLPAFPVTSSLPLIANLHPWARLFCPPVLRFGRKKIKRNTWHLCYFEIKIATEGGFLVIFPHTFVLCPKLVCLL
jgi:hypothetical protein